MLGRGDEKGETPGVCVLSTRSSLMVLASLMTTGEGAGSVAKLRSSAAKILFRISIGAPGICSPSSGAVVDSAISAFSSGLGTSRAGVSGP